jgi:hypothetical protein
MAEPPYNVKELSEHLTKSPGAVYNLVLRRKIPFRKVAGRLYFIPKEIEQWIDQAPGVRVEEVLEN